MGLFDDAASAISGPQSSSRKHRSSSHKHHKSSSRRGKSRSRSRSPGIAASIFGGGDYHKRNSSRSSFFGLGGDSHYHKNNASRGSFFNLGNASRGSIFGFGGGRSPSYYKRSPRQNFMQRAYKKLKRLLRDLVHYAKRHPYKVFMLAVMPLITGGALTALLARFGLRMPPALESMLGLGAKAMAGDSIGLVGEAVRMASGAGAGAASVSVARGWDGERSWERRTVDRGGDDDLLYGALGSLGSSFNGGSNSGWMGNVAKMFS
ncbi:hypothetical protein MCOR25_002293 [Pyricularia grisea]|uniref:Uncharacterized protein n=1 Tax=Pyricularia grisea TaxID=148305 RepID=A0A6P8ASX6_PYRGI|nr:uncharacterized protein PgNI_09349 [Pyricularia grisea]KAI6378427.1 hypothetical protein MCOR25_002293 [Pyricularia grisea]TLD05230.1 hypothetical protein PgNI_09349 [Pyricularia grisea]